jgi:hypothetical protein
MTDPMRVLHDLIVDDDQAGRSQGVAPPAGRVGQERRRLRRGVTTGSSSEGALMRRDNEAGPWVVYRATMSGTTGTVTVVCSQAEWDALDRTTGRYTLLQKGILNEAEAERVARDSQVKR